MADTVLPPVRSRMMAAVKARDTAPEISVRRRFHAAGHRFRLHRCDLPGRPDVVFPSYRIAVFVHGCFWHGHDCRRGRRPSSNVEFWDAKLARNAERDREAVETLEREGWRVATIWECALKAGTDDVLCLLNAARAGRRN